VVRDDESTRRFCVFYVVELPKLVGFVMKATKATVDDAADAAHSALAEAWEKWDTLRNPRAWVRTVAIRMYYRSSPRREVPLDDRRAVNLVAADVEFSPSGQTAAVLALLDLLPPTQRIVLAYSTEGFSDSEIAALLDKSVEAVRQNRHRARTTLKAHLVAKGVTHARA
jgi:RNA polymerase sigma factor (sigma-70 family)